MTATNSAGTVINKQGGEFLADGTFRFYYKTVLNNINYDVTLQVLGANDEIIYKTGLELEA